VLYLPAVAALFVTATAAGALGHGDWGRLAFGAGFFSWLAIESVLLHRLYTVASMPAALRPTLGIQLAPPVVGAVAYLSVTSGAPDPFAYAMLGYGLLQALLMLRFAALDPPATLCTFLLGLYFGATALATAPLAMVERGATGAVGTIGRISSSPPTPWSA
jgi:tellurite resistance protein